MNFKLGMVVSYIPRSGIDIRKAAGEFFGKHEISPQMPNFEHIGALFNEWMIFDYKIPAGVTVITEYFLKNPDQLPEHLIEELRQIIETQEYDLFEAEGTLPGLSVTVAGLTTGKRYTVSERSLSLSIGNRRGSFYNRIAHVGGQYYFVGSDPLFYPLTFTDRTKKMFVENNKDQISPKHALELLLKPIKSRQSIKVSQADIKQKRLNLVKLFERLKLKYRITTSFDELKDFLYRENYKGHYADFYTDLKKIGIVQKVVIENTRFFEDFWNYFPHKVLGDKCPAEKYQKYYG